MSKYRLDELTIMVKNGDPKKDAALKEIYMRGYEYEYLLEHYPVAKKKKGWFKW